jgi:hypothetical protein
MILKRPKQIVKLLDKADEEQAKGKSVEDICREEGISLAIYHRWQRVRTLAYSIPYIFTQRLPFCLP